MNRLSLQKRAQIIGMLVEGCSLRTTSRLADVAYNTVLKQVRDIGIATSEYQDKVLRNLICKRIQVDEIWSFCYAKEKTIKRKNMDPNGIGSLWTWTAIDYDTKLVPSWYVADRGKGSADIFMQDLASRVVSKTHITSDGYTGYIEAVDNAFGEYADYSMVVKQYDANGRYEGSEKKIITGKPEMEEVSTNIVERQNLTMRMGIRRFARKTNAFSKKLENHSHAVSLHFMYYNFARIHKTLRVTPAMEAGISDHIWELEEIAALME